MNLENLARPPRVGYDSGCGCPGCQSHTRLIDASYPQHLTDVYPQEQWDNFLSSINSSLADTAVPICPLALCAVLPPALCMLWYCRDSRAAEREEAVQSRINAENERLALVGLQWSDASFLHSSLCCIRNVPILRGSLMLQMNVQRRTQYELDNPQAPQYLANVLLERSQRQPSRFSTTTAVRTGAQTPRLIETTLDEAQQRLVTRQHTMLIRRASLSRVGGDASGASALPDSARWAQPVHALPNDDCLMDSPSRPAFVAVMPDSPPMAQDMA